MPLQAKMGIHCNGQRAQGFATPSTGTDGANKDYVDAVAAGLQWKLPVRAASTGNVSIAAAPAAIDGVTLSNGDRVLLKDQTSGLENGIRVFTAPGAALARATDADTNAEVKAGMTVLVTEGTANGDKAFTLTTNDPIVLNTTALVFAQIGGGSTYVAGNGLLLTGNSFSVVADPVSGGGILVTSSGVKVDTSVVVRKFAATYGNGSSTQITVPHNLGTQDVTMDVWDISVSPREKIYPDIFNVDANNTRMDFPTAPAASSIRAVVHG